MVVVSFASILKFSLYHSVADFILGGAQNIGKKVKEKEKEKEKQKTGGFRGLKKIM